MNIVVTVSMEFVFVYMENVVTVNIFGGVLLINIGCVRMFFPVVTVDG